MASHFELVATKFHEHSWKHESTSFTDPITSLATHPTGNGVYVGDLTGKLHAVEVEGVCPVPTDVITVSTSRITVVAVNPSGDLFACTSSDDSRVILGCCTKSGAKFAGSTFEIASTSRPLSVSFMQDHFNKQSLLLVGSKNGMKIIDTESGAQFTEMKSNTGVCDIHSWNGCMVAVGSMAGTVELWDARTKQPVRHFPAKIANKRSIFSIDCEAQVMALAGQQGKVHLFDLRRGKEIMQKKICEDDVKALSFSPRMRLLLAVEKTKLSIVNLNEISVSPFPFPSKEVLACESITGVRWHPSKCSFISRSTDRKLRSFTLDLEDMKSEA